MNLRYVERKAFSYVQTLQSVLRFSFDAAGAKEKLTKEKRRNRGFALASATADRGGSDELLKKLEQNLLKASP